MHTESKSLWFVLLLVNIGFMDILAAQPSSFNSQKAGTGRLSDSFVHVQAIKIMDTFGFKTPVIAYRMLIPAGWKAGGGVVWNKKKIVKCGAANPYVSWHATASNGIGQISVLPEQKWTGVVYKKGSSASQTSACPNVTNTDIRKFSIAYAKRLRPGAKIVSYRHRPDIVQTFQSEMSELKKQAKDLSTNSLQVRQWIEAGQVMVSYKTCGVEVYEIIVSTVIYYTVKYRQPEMSGVDTMVSISVLPGFSMRMRKENVDEKMIEMIRRSVMTTPEYDDLMAWYYNRLTRKRTNTWILEEQLIGKSEKEKQRIRAQIYQSFRQPEPGSFQRCNKKIKIFPDDVIAYKSPGSPCDTLLVKNTYPYVWQLVDGTFVLTDAISFNPLSSIGMKGKRLLKLKQESIK